MASFEEINAKGIAKLFNDDITEQVAQFFETEMKLKAQVARNRTKIIKSHGHRYTYAKYQNTGQLARNIKVLKKGNKRIVQDGTRADYTSGYHGMYFLVEKAGERDVKAVLNKGKKFTEALKL